VLTNIQIRNPFNVSWTTTFRHSFIRNWNCPLAAGRAYGQAAAAGLVHFYIGVLYAVMPKIVKSNDNVLSYACANLIIV